MREKDFNAIEQIAAKANPQNHFNLSRALVVLVVQRPQKGIPLAMEFLGRCHENEADHFFLFLSNNEADVYESLKYLVLNGSLRFGLAYNMEKCLNEVFKAEGNDIIYSYLLSRVEYKRQLIAQEAHFIGYELAPEGRHTHLFDDIGDEPKLDLFRKMITWYCYAELNSSELYYLKGLFSLFIREEMLTKYLHALFDGLTLIMATQKNGLKRLLDILAMFHHKNEMLIQLVEKIHTTALHYGNTDADYKKVLNYAACWAITEVGVKSGKAGEPFQVDLDLKELVEGYARQVQPDAPFNTVLNHALGVTAQNIDHSYDRDNETW
jgi:hypothetical protein